jgi:hypothetical protein
MICPTSSAWGAPVLFAHKKDGSLRFCIDYRRLNTMIEKDANAAPLINEVLSDLHGSTIFTTMDLHNGYYQTAMESSSIPITAFKTRFGNYEWMVLPMGLTNAPATFICMMNLYFFQYIRDFLQVYMDDLLTYSKNFDDHLEHLEKVLKILKEKHLQAKPKKCCFAMPEVEYLGHIISGAGVHPSPKKVKDIQEQYHKR